MEFLTDFFSLLCPQLALLSLTSGGGGCRVFALQCRSFAAKFAAVRNFFEVGLVGSEVYTCALGVLPESMCMIRYVNIQLGAVKISFDKFRLRSVQWLRFAKLLSPSEEFSEEYPDSISSSYVINLLCTDDLTVIVYFELFAYVVRAPQIKMAASIYAHGTVYDATRCKPQPQLILS